MAKASKVSKAKNPAAKKPVAKKATAKKPIGKALAKKATDKKLVAKRPPQKTKAKPIKKAFGTIAPITKSAAVKTAKAAVAKPAPRPSRPAGLPEQLRDAALTILDERQAEEIVTFDLGGRSSVADYLIVASGRASRQLSAIAHYITEAFEKLGVPRARVEGLPEANWVLIDGGDVIIHLFMPEVRGFYNLEGIWGRNAK